MPQVSKQKPEQNNTAGISQSLKTQSQQKKPLIQNSQQAEHDVWGQASLQVLIYGQSGTGKTTLASTFPEPLLWLICSGGNKPGELKSINTPENRKRITPKVVRSSEQLPGYIDKARQFATVVVDHITGLADLKLAEILGIDKLPEQKHWGLATQQDYGNMALECKETFRALLNLPCNVIFLAQERVFNADDANTSEIIKPTVAAALSPSLVGWLNPACDYVLQTFKAPRMRKVTTVVNGKPVFTFQRDKGTDYCVRCEPHDTFFTKFRVPRGHYLPDVIKDCNYEKLAAVIDGTYKERYEKPPEQVQQAKKPKA